MQEAILIQTDFRVESLILIKTAILNNPKTKLDIVLVHGICITDSITELLFFSKQKILAKISNEAFDKGLNDIRMNFAGNINTIRVELFTGFNQAAFNNFLSANKINQIFYSTKYIFRSNYKYSKDLSPFISKSIQEKVEVSWSTPAGAFNRFALSQ